MRNEEMNRPSPVASSYSGLSSASSIPHSAFRTLHSLSVAHFIHRYPPALGGAEAYFARLSRHLVARGHRVTVFTTTALDLEAFWGTRGARLRPGRSSQDGVEVRRYRLHHLPLHQTRVLRALSLLPVPAWQAWTASHSPLAWGMWADASWGTERFDVVHASAFPYGFVLACARRLARRLGVPFLLTPFLHLGDLDAPSNRERRAYTSPGLLHLAHSADRVFVQTPGERDALLALGLPAERLMLQGLGVDVAECRGGNRERARAAWGAAAGEVVVGHLANNSREKGSVDLLRAAQRAWEAGARFRLVLAGPEMPNFRAFWSGFRPRGPVARLGRLSEPGKRDFFAGIDAFALPSRTDSFGLVFLEAWANDVPCLAYRAGGVPWVVRDGVDGLLVRCGDVAALAEALGQLVGEEGLRRRLGAAGRERVGREFVWGEKLAVVERAYESVVSSQ
jgi:glycosyltransferase involved in cell wall biosynthesis